MQVRIGWITLFTALLTITNSAQAKCDSNLNAEVEKIIANVVQKSSKPLPATQISILCSGETTPRDFVVGNTAEGSDIPITPNTLFKIGSETKSFTAAIILQLEAEGVLDIHDPIGKWLPNLPSAWQTITIRQLLNHTSGLEDYTMTPEFFAIEIAANGQIQWEPNGLLKFIIDKPLVFAPGQGFHYSNTNYLIAGMLITAITGQSYEEVVNARLIQPFHLTNTYYMAKPIYEPVYSRLARGYEFSIENSKGLDVTNANMSAAASAGAMISNSHDVAIWLKNLLNGSVLENKQMQELTDWVDMDMETGQSQSGSYGLAMMRSVLRGEEIWEHSGGAPGYTAYMMRFNCRDLIITSTTANHAYIEGDVEDAYGIITSIFKYIQKADPMPQCKAIDGDDDNNKKLRQKIL